MLFLYFCSSFFKFFFWIFVIFIIIVFFLEFFGLFVLFLKLLRLLLNFFKVTTGHKKWPKIGQNSIISRKSPRSKAKALHRS